MYDARSFVVIMPMAVPSSSTTGMWWKPRSIIASATSRIESWAFAVTTSVVMYRSTVVRAFGLLFATMVTKSVFVRMPSRWPSSSTTTTEPMPSSSMRAAASSTNVSGVTVWRPSDISWPTKISSIPEDGTDPC